MALTMAPFLSRSVTSVHLSVALSHLFIHALSTSHMVLCILWWHFALLLHLLYPAISSPSFLSDFLVYLCTFVSLSNASSFTATSLLPMINQMFRIIAPKSAVDISTRLSHKWNVPLTKPLDVSDIPVYLDAPLDPEEKIPIPDVEWELLLRPDISLPEHFCTPEDLGQLFTKTEDETANFICHNVLVAIHMAQPDPSGTEDSFHAFWDRNILEILVTCLGKPRWIRNSNKGTNTGSSRPDLGLLLRSACVFRGEEKRPN
jgi:hypothetical protein